jgi:hypothetical protein
VLKRVELRCRTFGSFLPRYLAFGLALLLRGDLFLTRVQTTLSSDQAFFITRSDFIFIKSTCAKSSPFTLVRQVSRLVMLAGSSTGKFFLRVYFFLRSILYYTASSTELSLTAPLTPTTRAPLRTELSLHSFPRLSVANLCLALSTWILSRRLSMTLKSVLTGRISL